MLERVNRRALILVQESTPIAISDQAIGEVHLVPLINNGNGLGESLSGRRQPGIRFDVPALIGATMYSAQDI